MTYIGLLRAVNLGPHNKVGMAPLRDLLVSLGMEDVRTLLQSGNVVFRSAIADAAEIERRLEAATATHLGVTTDYFVRSASEWKALVGGNPFRDEAMRDPGHLLAVCLKSAPTRAAVDALQRSIKGREVVRAKGRCAYIVYPDGVGRSRLTAAAIEKALGCRGTARNWNTVLKLSALAGGA